MKLIVIIITILLFSICVFLFKKENRSKISNNQGATKGTITKVFYRGKLPFCEFEYQVDRISYTKKQEISKGIAKKILYKDYTVFYEKDHPKNAIIKFNKKESLN